MSQVEENRENNKSGSRSTVVVSLAALGSVIAASSCCLPLLPFIFAAGAAGTSAFIAQLRPYLVVLSVLLIAFGFYKSWRAKQCNCTPSRISTFILWFSAIVVFVFIFFPQVIANLWLTSWQASHESKTNHSCCFGSYCVWICLLLLRRQRDA